MKFIALDLETANAESSSICQIGFVVVHNGQIIKEKCLLIQPPDNKYDARHSCIHGIDALQTKDEPTFSQVWELLRTELTDSLLILHNASFDINILNATLDYYDLPKPSLRFECTYQMTGLSLKSLAEALQIDMEDHHNALSDARTCALAYLNLIQGKTPNLDLITNKKSDLFAGHEKLSGEILKPIKDVDNPCNPFYKKKVVFTGVLQTMTRGEAASLVQALGADIDQSVNKNTNFVIVGHGAGPSKLRKIDEYNSKGSSIIILKEGDFVSKLKNSQ